MARILRSVKSVESRWAAFFNLVPRVSPFPEGNEFEHTSVFYSACCSRHGKMAYDFHNIKLPGATIVVGV